MISIIIPVLNEASTIMDTLSRVLALEGAYEVIVVDGGSCDNTVDLASQYVKVFTSEKGRGHQMDYGAAHAEGDILWFVHSDSRVALTSISSIETACHHVYAGGCFSLKFYDSNALNLKWLAWTSNVRAKYLKLMYGDQGIFVKKSVYEHLKGFDHIPIMEDWNFSLKLAKSENICLLNDVIGTSGRRFKEGGFLKTLLKMHWLKWRYIRGTSPEKLIEYYREIR